MGKQSEGAGHLKFAKAVASKGVAHVSALGHRGVDSGILSQRDWAMAAPGEEDTMARGSELSDVKQ